MTSFLIDSYPSGPDLLVDEGSGLNMTHIKEIDSLAQGFLDLIQKANKAQTRQAAGRQGWRQGETRGDKGTVLLSFCFSNFSAVPFVKPVNLAN